MRKTPRRKPTENQIKVAAYVAEGRHKTPRGGAKTIRQIADDLGMHPCTVRNVMKTKHYGLWAAHWAPIEIMFPETFAAIQAHSVRGGPSLIDQMPPQDRDALADEEEAEARYR